MERRKRAAVRQLITLALLLTNRLRPKMMVRIGSGKSESGIESGAMQSDHVRTSRVRALNDFAKQPPLLVPVDLSDYWP